MPTTYAIDVETTGLDPWKDRLLGVSLAWRDDTTRELQSAWYDWDPATTTPLPWPHDILARDDVTLVGHNLRFDMKFLAVHTGTTPRGRWQDTRLMAALILKRKKPGQAVSHGLKSLVPLCLGKGNLPAHDALQEYLKENRLTMKDLGKCPPRLVRDYCREDTVNALKLYEFLVTRLTPELASYYNQEMLPLEKLLLEMELYGLRVDTALLAQADRETARLINHAESTLRRDFADEIKQAVPIVQYDMFAQDHFDFDKPRHVRALLYDVMNLGHYVKATTEKGEKSISRKDIQAARLLEGRLKNLCNRVIERASLSKNRSAYVWGISERLQGEVIHAEYYQVSGEGLGIEGKGGTASGRLSHRNPNMGNLPRSSHAVDSTSDDYWKNHWVKDLFTPRPGKVFVYADYDQIELRVAAVLSGDKPFIDAFNAGLDPHQATADAIGISRQQAKTVNFLLIYFGSPWRLCHELGADPAQDEEALARAEKIHADFFRVHWRLKQWVFDTRKQLSKIGYVASLFGRPRWLPEVWSTDKKVAEHALRQGVNHIVQSTAASICKRAMLKIDALNGCVQNSTKKYLIVNQVHDSICVEVNEATAQDDLILIKKTMEEAVPFGVPLTVGADIIKTFRE